MSGPLKEAFSEMLPVRRAAGPSKQVSGAEEAQCIDETLMLIEKGLDSLVAGIIF